MGKLNQIKELIAGKSTFRPEDSAIIQCVEDITEILGRIFETMKEPLKSPAFSDYDVKISSQPLLKRNSKCCVENQSVSPQ